MVHILERIDDKNYIGEEHYIQEPEDAGASGEVALWRAVITQALMDAGNASAKSEMRRERREAISWLSGLSEDFAVVCLLAERDPDAVKTSAREAIGRGCAWRRDMRGVLMQRKEKWKRCSPLAGEHGLPLQAGGGTIAAPIPPTESLRSSTLPQGEVFKQLIIVSQ